MKINKKVSHKETKERTIKALELLIEVIKGSKEIDSSSIKSEHETKPIEIIKPNMSHEELVPQRTGWINLEFFIRYKI